MTDETVKQQLRRRLAKWAQRTADKDRHAIVVCGRTLLALKP